MTIRGLMAGAALTLAAAGAVEAQDQTQGVTISDVQVEADLTAVANPQAAEYWGQLESDLSAALAGEFVGQIAPEGLVLIVDVDEISMASFLQAQAGADDARLSGDIGLYNPRTEEVERLFTISATANEAQSYLPQGTDVVTVSPDSAEFYAAVIRAFARGVADTVRGS